MTSTEVETDITTQLDSIRAELVQMRLIVGQLIAIETGERVRVPLPVHPLKTGSQL